MEKWLIGGLQQGIYKDEPGASCSTRKDYSKNQNDGSTSKGHRNQVKELLMAKAKPK